MRLPPARIAVPGTLIAAIVIVALTAPILGLSDPVRQNVASRLAGPAADALLGGTVLVEYVFNWPGLSTPLIRAVEGRDYPMVVGIVLTISGLFLLINMIVELLYGVLDPRARAR